MVSPNLSQYERFMGRELYLSKDLVDFEKLAFTWLAILGAATLMVGIMSGVAQIVEGVVEDELAKRKTA